ncbi:MAG: NAD(P)-binding protein [Verrucomicrobiota bacterium]
MAGLSQNEITIIGGGIAGLALGISLRRRDVPVTLLEASSYPRHRVCGEFLSGVSKKTLESLGLSSLLADAERLQTTGWWDERGSFLEATLPEPALGISRFRFDQRMAEEFERLGGVLRERTRFRIGDDIAEGTVLATGRPLARESDWLGLKAHFLELPLEADLEMHLGEDGYLGMSRVEDGRVNACGLFRKRDLRSKSTRLLGAYVRTCGLPALADRLDSAANDPDSCVGISSFSFGRQKREQSSTICLGDRGSIIPPFTGNGMSMALQSAELALPLLLTYARGETSWETSHALFERDSQTRFRKRLGVSRWLHPAMMSPRNRTILRGVSRAKLLPFHLLYRALR